MIKDAQIAVGLFNDQENFYVCISSWNDDVNLQALNLGLTVWFDPGGGEEKKFGIEYPLVEERIQSPDRGAPGDVVPLPEASARPSNRLAIRGPTGGGMRGGGASTRETGPESPRIPKPLKVAAKIRLAAVDSPPGE